jgi:RNA polymerase sigma factor (sigma-70 family)
MSTPKSANGADFQKLADRLGDDDESALGDLIRELVPVLAGQLTRRFGRILNTHDIDDVLARMLCRVWERRRQYRQTGAAFPNWCYLIARNFAIDAIRTKAREREHLKCLWRELQGSREPAKAAVPVLSALQEALSRLSVQEREVLSASVSSDEAAWAVTLARSMNLEPGNIRQKRFRALNKLRNEMVHLGYIQETQ